ncbi:MAG: hypothetical protein CM15mP44_6460 [Candidatus Neomarinimicrobiota bacterium]|nr:MAG: hypothetical protein CM15mP44_6460 [Candidatus Neomarinimicrobiota bacterium]
MFIENILPMIEKEAANTSKNIKDKLNIFDNYVS